MANEVNPYSREAMEAECDRLEALEVTICGDLTPLQEQLGLFLEAGISREDEVTLRERIKALNDQLYPVMQTLTSLRRALPGYRAPGSPDAAPEAPAEE